MIARCAHDAAKLTDIPKLSSFNGSPNCQILARLNVNVVPSKDIKVFANGGCIFIILLSRWKTASILN
jgi:hypothetical protein